MNTFLGATSAGRLAGFRSSLLICEDINKDVAVFAAGWPMLVPGGAVGYGHTLNLLGKRFGRYTRITLFRVLCCAFRTKARVGNRRSGLCRTWLSGYQNVWFGGLLLPYSPSIVGRSR